MGMMGMNPLLPLAPVTLVSGLHLAKGQEGETAAAPMCGEQKGPSLGQVLIL